jgi:hypothetical protein
LNCEVVQKVKFFYTFKFNKDRKKQYIDQIIIFQMMSGHIKKNPQATSIWFSKKNEAKCKAIQSTYLENKYKYNTSRKKKSKLHPKKATTSMKNKIQKTKR